MANTINQMIEETIESLPPLPTIVTRVLKVTSDPESSANDLLRSVAPDPSICAAILKIANSSLFGRPRKVRSLEKAIMVLGFNEVKSIVLANAVVSSFIGMTQLNKTAVAEFWDHSFTTGLAAKIIGEQLHQSSGQYFIAGLLHDIGKLTMLLTFDEQFSPVEWMTEFSTEERIIIEKHTFKATHTEAGCYLLNKWNFPEDIVVTIKAHHAPLKVQDFASFALVIQLADVLAHLCCTATVNDDDINDSIKTYVPDIEEQWLSLGLPWDEVAVGMWYAWLKIDKMHGSSIMTFLA